MRNPDGLFRKGAVLSERNDEEISDSLSLKWTIDGSTENTNFASRYFSVEDHMREKIGAYRQLSKKSLFMKIRIAARYGDLEPFVRSLASRDFFVHEGETLYQGRNTIKRFRVGGQDLAVKSYGRLIFFNRLIYGVLRRSKAERAYRHAIRLRGLGIGTPEEVAFLEIRRYGLLQYSYFVSICSDYEPMRSVTEQDPGLPEVGAALDALAQYLFGIHNAGVLHKDLNIGNILYRRNRAGGYDFQLIDTNRMRFYRTLPLNVRLDNLRRLSCPAPAYLYLLDRYARLAHADRDSIQLRGAVMRLFFEMRQRLKYGVKGTCKRLLRSGFRRHPVL